MNNAMIEFRHVSKSFSRKGHPVLALQDINLSIERGDIFGIIGYSGAGKSTLLRLINRLETPGEGEVLLNGEPLQACSGQRLQAIKKDIGMIFQNFNLLNSKTVFHNIAIPLILQGRDKAFIQARVAELLAFVDLSDKIHSYPNELSGGQKQRVGIARALATRPRLLLCDEATSALDPQTTQSILQLLLDINQRLGLTIILITHEMDVIRSICDRVAVLDDGRVVESGPVTQVFLHPRHPTTRRFVQEAEHIDEYSQDDDFAHVAGRIVRLTFVGNATYEATLSQVIREHSLEFSILAGRIERIKATPCGQLVLALDGTQTNIDNALASLGRHDVTVEVLR